MAVAYHTHVFQVPEATDEQAAAGTSREVFLVPANLPPLLAEKQGLNDALTSIAGLTTSADQMIYTTGADAYATTALTAYGRSIVGSIDASAVLALLGAGTTGTALFQDETAADARTTLELGSLATLSTISNTNWSGADLAIENGGTGASSADVARTNLGLGTAATADSTAFATAAQGLLADSAVQPGDGAAVPIGGTTGQVLAKASATDGDTFWTAAGTGDVLSTNNGSDFANLVETFENLQYQPRPVTAPAYVRNPGDWMRQKRWLRDFLTTNVDPDDWSTAFNLAISEMLSVDGGELNLHNGYIDLGSTVNLDVRGLTGGPAANLKRLNIKGQGPSTVLRPGDAAAYALHVQGDNPLTSASHGFITISDFAVAGASPFRNANGIHIQDMAFTRWRDITFDQLDTCMVLTGCLSSRFDGMNMRWSNKGVTQQAGASGPHGNLWNYLQLSQIDGLGFDGFDSMSGATFINPHVENCGVHGDSASGGMIFRMSGSAGEAGPTFIGGYIEGNAGGFDLKFSQSAQRIPVTIIGTLFNRNHGDRYTINNIITSGDVDLNLATTHSSYNDYVPDAARPYLNLSAGTRFRNLGCRFEDVVEAPILSESMSYAGFVDGSTGAAVATGSVLPPGWSVVQASSGLFTVTHGLGHQDYIVTATVQGGDSRTVERIVRNNTNFQAVIKNSTGTNTDADFGFQLQVLKPHA